MPNARKSQQEAGRLSVPATLGRITAFGLLVVLFFVVIAFPADAAVPLEFEPYSVALAALFALAVMARLDRSNFHAFGLVGNRSLITDTALGFAIGAATMSAVALTLFVCGWYHPAGLNTSAEVRSNLTAGLGEFLAIGIAEELIYRGYVLQTLERRWGTDRALALTILVFGIAHLFIDIPGTHWLLRLTGALSISAEAGVLFGAAYLLRRRLWLAIGVHWAWNFCEGPVFGMPVTGSDVGPSLVYAHTSGPVWATGGSFGPEAGIPCLVLGTLAGLALLETGYRNKTWRHGIPAD